MTAQQAPPRVYDHRRLADAERQVPPGLGGQALLRSPLRVRDGNEEPLGGEPHGDRLEALADLGAELRRGARIDRRRLEVDVRQVVLDGSRAGDVLLVEQSELDQHLADPLAAAALDLERAVELLRAQQL